MSEDLISRQTAIDAIGKASDELYENIKKGATFPQRQWFDGMAQAQSILENLPSAELKRKRGEWIHGSELSREREPLWKYCPYCGAKMEKGEDDAEDD